MHTKFSLPTRASQFRIKNSRISWRSAFGQERKLCLLDAQSSLATCSVNQLPFLLDHLPLHCYVCTHDWKRFLRRKTKLLLSCLRPLAEISFDQCIHHWAILSLNLNCQITVCQCTSLLLLPGGCRLLLVQLQLFEILPRPH